MFQEYHDAHDDLYELVLCKLPLYTKNSCRFSAIPFEIKTALVLAIIVVLFHILDRQIEFTSRTDYLWKAKLKVEQEEVETMRGINKVIKVFRIYFF